MVWGLGVHAFMGTGSTQLVLSSIGCIRVGFKGGWNLGRLRGVVWGGRALLPRFDLLKTLPHVGLAANLPAGQQAVMSELRSAPLR